MQIHYIHSYISYVTMVQFCLHSLVICLMTWHYVSTCTISIQPTCYSRSRAFVILTLYGDILIIFIHFIFTQFVSMPTNLSDR